MGLEIYDCYTDLHLVQEKNSLTATHFINLPYNLIFLHC